MLYEEFLEEELNRPGLTEQYLMSVALEVRRVPDRVWGSDPNVHTLEDLKLRFERRRQVEAPDEVEEDELGRVKGSDATITLAVWARAMGFPLGQVPGRGQTE